MLKEEALRALVNKYMDTNEISINAVAMEMGLDRSTLRRFMLGRCPAQRRTLIKINKYFRDIKFEG